jgi:hypothetical protein
MPAVSTKPTNENDKVEKNRDHYVSLLAPLFFPSDPTKPDIVQLFSSLLRVVGMEDKGWDPHAESRAFLEDLNALFQLELPENKFHDRELTVWRLGLLFYSHVIEMAAPYEVITNLLRFRLGKGYSPNPFYGFLREDQRKRFKKTGLFPRTKIDIINSLSAEAGLDIGTIFDDFVDPDFRNAIAHSDFIFTDSGFRCRRDHGFSLFEKSFEEVDDLIAKSKAYVGAFLGLEREARRMWGTHAGKPMAYDPRYKGVMEVLVDDLGFMNGFKVHWPNGSDSYYRRTENGVEMVNCSLDFTHKTLNLFVDLYARNPGTFSPLVEQGSDPRYTDLATGEPTTWSP